MIRPATKVLFHITATAVAATVFLLAIFMWFVLTGPVSMGPLTRLVENEINRNSGALKVDIDDAVLRWSRSERTLQFRFLDVALADSDGAVIGRAPEMELGFSTRALLRGQVAPTHITLIGPKATIIRHSTGEVEVNIDTVDADDQALSFESVMALLSEEPSPESVETQLRAFLIKDAKLTFFDQTTKTYWRARKAALSFTRDDGAVKTDLSTTLQVGTKAWKIDVDGRLDQRSGLAHIDFELGDITPSGLAEVSPVFGELRRVDIPYAGTGSIIADLEGHVEKATLSLNADSGSVSAPILNGDAIDIIGSSLVLAYDDDTRTLEINELSLNANALNISVEGNAKLDGPNLAELHAVDVSLVGKSIDFDLPKTFTEPGHVDQLALEARYDIDGGEILLNEISLVEGVSTINLSGRIETGDEAGPAVTLRGDIKDFAVDLLPKLWPIYAANGAHDWSVANLSDGRISKGTLRLDARPGDLDKSPLDEDVLEFAFDFDGLTSNYINGLTPMKRASGKALLTGDTFRVTVDKGWVNNLKVSEGFILITELHKRPSTGDITAVVSGNTSEILQILDMEPLGYPSQFGIVPDQVGGEASVRMRAIVPMKRDVTFAMIDFSSSANMANLSLPPIVNELAISNGEATIDINNDGLRANGAIVMAGVPFDLTWTENFVGEVGSPTNLKLSGLLDGDDAHRLGLDLRRNLDGAARFEVKLSGRGQDIERSRVKVDFGDAALTIPELDWRKPEGEKFAGAIDVRFTNQQIDLKQIRFRGTDAEINGQARLAKDGSLQKLVFDRFRLGTENDVRIETAFPQGRQASVSVSGRTLNVGGLIAQAMNGSMVNDEEEDDDEPQSPINVEAELDRLVLANDVVLLKAHGGYSHNGDQIIDLTFEADFEEGGTVFVAQTTTGDADRHLRVNSTDAGLLIKGLDITKTVVGGSMDVVGDFVADTPPAAPSPKAVVASLDESEAVTSTDESVVAKKPEPDLETRLIGSLSIKDFRIVKAPLAAKVLGLGSFTGMGDLLQGEGIAFSEVDVPFMVEDDLVIFDKSQAYGPSVGLTMRGSYDREEGELDLSGTVVPAYSINSFFGNVPLLGGLLVSREGEGVIGVTYQVSGAADDPSVSVNPLSALAPGFLRRLFQLDDSRHATIPRPKPSVQ